MSIKIITAASCIAALAAGLAIAQPWEGREGPNPEQRKEFMEKRIAKLPAAEQELARQVMPARDSLMRAIGDYKNKVHDGSAARTLTIERAAIQRLQSRVWALESQNPDITLDLLADLPGPFPGGRGDKDHHPWGGPKGCPRHGGDSLPPPPQD